MKKRMRMPYGTICKTLQLSLASFKRWRHRIRGSMVLIYPPGPKKVEPFDPSILDREIQCLNHGTKRSAGTNGLYLRYCFSVSRRELGEMVDEVRHDLETDRRARIRWIEWLIPGIVWAMDATGYSLGMVGKSIFITRRIWVHGTSLCRWLQPIRKEKRWLGISVRSLIGMVHLWC